MIGRITLQKEEQSKYIHCLTHYKAKNKVRTNLISLTVEKYFISLIKFIWN